jgi:menaquinol-cytochrome c reductase iron-sulfur subunit
MSDIQTMPQALEEQPPDRRGFLKRFAAVIIGGLIVLIPGVAGLLTFFDPLRRKSSFKAELVKVTTLDSLPDDGMPRKFQVIKDRTDAWTHHPKAPVGAVYLCREPGSEKVSALNVVCPHAGCFVDVTAEGTFHCPCHNSSFRKDGSLIPGSVSPRGMDPLEVAVNQGNVLVKYENFQAGTDQRILQ